MKPKATVLQMGLDTHRTFSKVAARDGQGKVVRRQRLDHADRQALRRRLGDWPKGTPVVLEGTFGWEWLSDELQAAGLEPHLASSRKVAAWRQARGMAKSNRTDNVVGLVRARARPGPLWSLPCERTAADLFVNGPPAPDEIM